ncbi:MAG: tannase/feruloyl esterase family alpha/beta hydrolase [Alphaproteobacteria bacterium]|nr:tannase/feruloyl esterase family alpha/beta hydrolase [Alphaproteobacteria bacterium]
MSRSLAALVFLVALSASPTVAQSTDACAALRSNDFTGIPDAPTAITGTAIVPASEGLPEYCRVRGTIAPAISFELRLPTKTWKEKFLMQGCGGMCGIINMAAGEDALARNYAVINQNMGHDSQPFVATWAYNNLQAEIDFGYRSTHVTAVAAKVLVEAYYGKAPDYSYFKGCSTGGRQAMVQAQRFPWDFDGIISGAPVLNEVGDGMLHLVWSGRANLDDDGKPILSSEKLPLIRNAVLNQCDAYDGVEDGVLQDPRTCDWQPSQLQCLGQDRSNCLTSAEIAAVERIYAGAYNSKGERLFPGGMSKGSEYEWSPVFVAPKGVIPTRLNRDGMIGQFARYLAYWQDGDGPGSDLTTFDFDRDPPRLALTEALYNAQNPDLRKFRDAGNKLVLYHGWDDMEIPPGLSIDYYETATNTMGGPEATQEFFRLFMIPGMAHCRRGPGADAFDKISALEAWVETGKAPDALTSYHLKKPQAYNGLPRIRHPISEDDYDWSRPVYPYPASAVWSGEGDWKDDASWKRVEPQSQYD